MNIKKKRRIKSTFLILFTILAVQFASIRESYALSAYFIQSLIDDQNANFTVDVVFDNPGKKFGLPFGRDSLAKQLERELGDFRDLKNQERISADAYLDTKPAFLADNFEITSDALLFTFPGWPTNANIVDDSSEQEGNMDQEASGVDYQLAQRVASTLGGSLQEVFSLVTGGLANSRSEVEEYGQKIITATNNNGTITFSKDGYTIESKFSNPSKDPEPPKFGVYPDDKYLEYKEIKIKTMKDGKEIDTQTVVLPWKIGKGYKSVDRNESKFITWSHLITQALSNAEHNNIISTNSYEIQKPGIVEKMIIDSLKNLGNGLASMLGLYTLNELMYSEGVRGSSSWVFGALPRAWWNGAMMFYVIFLFLALATMSMAVAKMILDVNANPLNPSKKMSLKEGLQKILISFVMLFINIPIILSLLSVNNALVKGLYEIGDKSFSSIGAFSANAGGLAAIFIAFAYLGMTVYYNFIYISRQVILTFLIGTSPIYIQKAAFSHDSSSIGTYYKELAGNIFIQSLHCTAMMMFVSGGMASRNIERLVILVSIASLTELARHLMFGQNSGVLGKMGMSSMGTAMGMAMGAAGIAGAVGTGLLSNGAGAAAGSLGGLSKMDQMGSGPMGISDGAPLRGAESLTSISKDDINKRSLAQRPTSFSNGKDEVTKNQNSAIGAVTESPRNKLEEGIMGVKSDIREASEKAKGFISEKTPDSVKKMGENISNAGQKAADVYKNNPNIGRGLKTAGAIAGATIGTAAMAGIGAGSGHPMGALIAAKGISSLSSKAGGSISSNVGQMKDSAVSSKQNKNVLKENAPNILKGAGAATFNSMGETTSYPINSTDPVKGLSISSGGEYMGADGMYSTAYADELFPGSSINDIVPSKEGNSALVTYDMNAVDQGTKERLEYASSLVKTHGEAREAGNIDQMNNTSMLLGEIGVDDVLVHPNGNLSVAYNEDGLKSMGVEKIKEYGQGENRRYEFKQSGSNSSGTLKEVPSFGKIDNQRYGAVMNWREKNREALRSENA